MPNERRCANTGALLFWPSLEEIKEKETEKRLSELEKDIENLENKIDLILSLLKENKGVKYGKLSID